MFVSTDSDGIRPSMVGQVSLHEKILSCYDQNSHYVMEFLNYRGLSQMGRKGNIMDSEEQPCPTDKEWRSPT